MDTKTLRKATLLGVVAALISALAAGCSSDTQVSPSGKNVGDIGFALSLPAGATIGTVMYTLTGPNNYSKSDSFSVADFTGPTFSTTLMNIPAGAGYMLSLTASSSDSRPCQGKSMSFAVVANTTVTVMVTLSCEGKKGANGSIMVDGKLNLCPVVESASVAPASAAVGATIALSGLGSQEDSIPSSTLSYAWTTSTTIGSLSNASTANATFTCSAAGTAAVLLTVSDGDTQCTGNTATVNVTCTTGGGTGGAGGEDAGPGAAGAGGAGAGGAGAGGDSCGACERNAPAGDTLCAENLALGEALTGNSAATSPVKPNTPRSQLFKEVLECAHRTGCGMGRTGGVAAATDCLCGDKRNPNECFNGTVEQMTGLCKNECLAAVETNVVTEIATRFSVQDFAMGQAVAVIELCDQLACMDACK